jgi:hypothetical protein
LAHLAQVGPACARASARARADPSRCPVGQSCRRRSSRTRARSLCPANPTCQLVPNLLPTFPRRGRAHDRTISDHPRTSSPLLSPVPHSPTSPTHLCPQPNPLAPLSLCARDQIAPSPLTVDRRPFCDRRRARAPSVASVSSDLSSATRDTLWFALPLSYLPGLRSPENFLRSQCPPPSTRGSTAPPSFPKRPGVCTRGEQPSHVFISPCIAQCPRNCSPEVVASPRDLSTAVCVLWCPRAGFAPMVEFGRSH